MQSNSSNKCREYNRRASVKRKARMAIDPEYAKRVRDKDASYRRLPKYQAKRRIANLKRLEKPEARIHNNVARLVRYSLKEAKGKCHTEDLLGYSKETLKKHLENQFDSNMSWSNYGTYWNIDHNYPRSWGDGSEADFKRIWALDNLRPLETKKNIEKADSWEFAPNVFISWRK